MKGKISNFQETLLKNAAFPNVDASSVGRMSTVSSLQTPTRRTLIPPGNSAETLRKTITQSQCWVACLHGCPHLMVTGCEYQTLEDTEHVQGTSSPGDECWDRCQPVWYQQNQQRTSSHMSQWWFSRMRRVEHVWGTRRESLFRHESLLPSERV